MSLQQLLQSPSLALSTPIYGPSKDEAALLWMPCLEGPAQYVSCPTTPPVELLSQLLAMLLPSASALVLKHGSKKRTSTQMLTYVPFLTQNLISVRLGSTGTRHESGGLVRRHISVISACACIVYVKLESAVGVASSNPNLFYNMVSPLYSSKRDSNRE